MDPKENFTHTDIVRMIEAIAAKPFLKPSDENFLYALQKEVARRLGLKELKSLELTGPAQNRPPAVAPSRPLPPLPRPADGGKKKSGS